MIKNLQFLRGIAALLIFYHHYGFKSPVFESFGDFGVVFFMILSGFVICYSTEQKYKKTYNVQSIHCFMQNRLIKIYPLYLLCWITSILIIPYTGSRLGKLLGIFALQSWWPEQEIFFSGNAVSWFICDLLFCYLLFIPTFRLMHRKPQLFNILTCIYFVLYYTIVLSIPDELVLGIVYINPLMQFANFLLGIMLCRWINPSAQSKNLKHGWIYQVAVIVLIAICMSFYPMIPKQFAYGAYWWLPVILCITIFTKTDFVSGGLNNLTHSSVAQLMGNLSFTFYMIHYIGISIWLQLINNLGLATNDILLRATQSVILVILLLVFSYFIERHYVFPIQSRLKKLLN